MTLVVLCLAVIAGQCDRITRLARAETVAVPSKSQRNFRILPDEIKLNGNHLRMVARADDGQRYLVSATVPKYQQLQQLKWAKRPLAVTIDGQVEPIQPATNENQFDSQRYYYAQGIYNCLHGSCVIKGELVPKGVEYLHVGRLSLMNYFKTFPSPLSLFCNRLLLGISDEELGETIRQVQILGIIHLFCLSGLHVTVLCRIIRQLLVFLNLPCEWITYCQMMMLPIYWFIGGGSISLTRAILMMEFGLFTQCYRRLRSVDGWSLTLTLHLLLMPNLIMSFGGDLSYLLSFSLKRIKWENGLRQTVGLTIISLPVVLNMTYQIHLLTMIVNWLLIPLFSWVLLPMLLICAFFGWLSVDLISFCNSGLIILQQFIKWLSELPGVVIFGKIGNSLTVVLIFLSLMAIEGLKQRKWPLITLVLTYGLIFCCYHFPIHGEVTFFDIGQGDSILIRTPLNRQVMMIDTGGRPVFKRPEWQKRRYQTDDAQRISVNYLKSKGISKIDVIFLSHRDADHLGYLASICRELQVRQIVVPAGMEQLATFYRRVPSGTRIWPVTNQSELAKLNLKVLHPFQPGEGRNEDSMVLYGIFGGKSFLFSGDLDRNGERKIIKYYPWLTADVVKLGHHGSKTSSDEHYLKKLHPKLAIISAGRNNRYGHPNQETITTLNHQHIPFWSTQKYGMIKYSFDRHGGRFQTTLRGDEFAWMQLP